MTNYSEIKYISPGKLYAKIREELRAFFATGAVDDLLFPIWTIEVLDKFEKTYFPVKQQFIPIKDGRAELPNDFDTVREIWTTRSYHSSPFNIDGSLYYQQDYNLVTLDEPTNDFSVDIHVESYEVVRKVSSQSVYTYTKKLRLQEDNDPSIPNTFMICEGEILANNVDCIHLVYYSDGLNDESYRLIPDRQAIKLYIEKYIVAKIFLILFNQTTDDTFNQANARLQMAKGERDEAYILADIESKKESQSRQLRKIKKTYNRLNRYKIK